MDKDKNEIMLRSETLPAVPGNNEPVSPALVMYESAVYKTLPVLSPVYSFLNESGWKSVPALREFLQFYKQQEYLNAANALVKSPHPFNYDKDRPDTGTGLHPLSTLCLNLQEYGIQLVKLNRSPWEFGLESYLNKPLSELGDLSSCFEHGDLENFQELARGSYRSFFPEFPEDTVSEAARKKTTYFHEWCSTFEQIAGNASKAFIRRHNIEEKHVHLQTNSSEIHPAIIARSLESDRPIDERILDIELFVRNKRSYEGSDMFVIVQYAQPKGIRCIPLQSSGRHQDFMYNNCDRESPCSACTPRALSAILQGHYKGVIQTADVRRLDPVYRKAHDRREWWRSSDSAFLGANIVGEVLLLYVE